jgi:Rho termination factor, N-terminal domain
MAVDTTLQGKTLKELQALAKSRGLKRYSGLTKQQLLRLLTASSIETTPTARRTQKARSGKNAEAEPPKPTQPRPTARPASAPPPTVAATPGSAASPAGETGAGEEWVERSKYVSRANGRAPSETFADLGEDIDRLPTLSEPLVCLLSQKPGVLHAYWVLPPEQTGERTDYRLRLCRATGAAVDVCEEVAISARQGNWYFHVADARDWQVQLGYYRDGRFVAARGRSVAQLPSLYASTRTDERWWISEADFMRMYLRAGGFVTANRRFGWNASIGSPAGAGAPGPTERLAWPGGVSSQPK